MNTRTLLPRSVQPEQEKPERPNPNPHRRLWWLLIVMIATIYAAFNVEDFDFLIEKDGKYELAPHRKEKLQKELEEYDEAEQYVIYASEAGYYPCYSCGKQTQIYLEKGEVWKYGSTRIGKNRRYGNVGIPLGLVYATEYIGDLTTCQKLEKIKIYNYALLPENLKRSTPLIRPPGNKVDF